METGKNKTKFNLFIKFVLIISAFLILILTIAGFVINKIQTTALIAEKVKSSGELADFVAGISARHIKKMSYYSLYESAERLQSGSSSDIDGEVLSVIISDTEGKKLNLNGTEESEIEVPRKYWLSLESDCVYLDLATEEEEIVGKLSMTVSLESIYQRARRNSFSFALIVLITILIMDFILIFLLRKMVTMPLTELTESAKRIAAGDFNINIQLRSRDEIGYLGQRITQMSRDLKSSFAEIEDLNAHLEQKVEERTEQVRKLLEQQNGDYYLTSLLISPLVANNVNSQNVKVDFYLNQKKKFSFRKWNSQLGGDICIAHNIMLRGKKYTVFANADAMGKSLQGSGGALVLGVIFNSYVERTLTNLSQQDRSAGDWLGQLYDELEAVFETFDGSMLISGIFGILNEYTGVLRFFNAEHPWLTLYRDGTANFADYELMMARKIGTIGFSGINIQKLQLKSGDILICGSDGKDDIEIGTDSETGDRIINEDEKLFLQAVNDAKGDLNKISEIVKGSGKLTDDFSMLRLEFTGQENFSIESSNEPDELKSEITLPELDMTVTEIHREKAKKYLRMDEKRREAVEFYKQGNYKGSLRILESIRGKYNRGPDNFIVYYLLGYCFYKLKEYKQAVFAWEEALAIDPGNDKLRKNTETLKKYI